MFKHAMVFSLEDAKQQVKAWRNEHNATCPHWVIQDRMPEEFAQRHTENDTIKEVKQARELAYTWPKWRIDHQPRQLTLKVA